MLATVVDGDLLDQPVDVLVNAWNRNVIPWWLLLPQGVSGAIKRRAGLAPFVELGRAGPLALGDALLTGPGRLRVRGIIHVAGIDLLWRASPLSIRRSVQSAMTEFSTALPLHKGGKARIIAVGLAQRSKLAPDIPTFIDGGVKGFTAQSYIGILAPAKTPAEAIDKVEKAIQNGLKPGSAAANRLAQLGAELATPEQMTAKGFAAFIRTDYDNMKEAAKLAGIKPQ